MAALVRSAPLPELTGDDLSSLVDKDFYNTVDNSLSIIKKIFASINETHKDCLSGETWALNKEKGTFALMAEAIGIPAAPILPVSPGNVSLGTSLVRMLEGVLLHQSLLSSVSTHLGPKDTVTELVADTRDLLPHLHELLEKIQGGPAELPVAPVLNLQLHVEYEVQVATHVTLQQLLDFCQDMERILEKVVTTRPTEPTQQ